MREAFLQGLRRFGLLGLVLLAGYCGWLTEGELRSSASVLFMDVGQGKGAVVIAPNGNTLLVDAGTQAYGRDGVGEQVATSRILPLLARMGIRRLSVIAVTHPDKDHCNAVPMLAKELPPRLFWAPAGESSEPDWLAVKATMHQLGVRTVTAQVGQRLWLDAKRGVVAEVLGPPKAKAVRVSEIAPNDASTVFKVRLGEVSVLLTGDIGETGQRWLLQSGADIQATILDVPHHGSRHNLETFLFAVRPEVAVISVGRQNPFGHPAPKTVETLRRIGAIVWLTGEQGSLKVTVQGRRWTLTGMP